MLLEPEVLITALNSKGLRHIHPLTTQHQDGIDHCPEFKGIKTRLRCDNRAGKVLITALNSKGLRRDGDMGIGTLMVLITALNSKGLRHQVFNDTARVWVLITALNSKGLRRYPSS